MLSKIAAIKPYGQKIWLDHLSRALLNSGQLQQLITADQISCITSNPAIFAKAISQDQEYRAQLTTLKKQTLSSLERYEAIAITDIQQACRLFLPLYRASNAADGYVSLEVAPDLCHDSEKTIASAKSLWRRVN